MSIEKKSLISNRIASKKAIVTKPGVSKVASPKSTPTVRIYHPTKLKFDATRVLGARIATIAKIKT